MVNETIAEWREEKMVSETNLEGAMVYKCDKCGWLYEEMEIAEKCESWCQKHKSCNLNYQKYAIKLKGENTI